MSGQDRVSTLRLHYRETWAEEYDIQIEIAQNVLTDNYLVTKTINHKKQTTSEIDWNAYYKIILEIDKLEKIESKKNRICTDGNSLLISVVNGEKVNNLKFNCIYAESNSEALDLLTLIKDLK